MPRLIGEQRRLLWTCAFGRCGRRWVLGDALEPFVEPFLDIGPRTIGVHFDVGTVKTEPTIERAEANEGDRQKSNQCQYIAHGQPS